MNLPCLGKVHREPLKISEFAITQCSLVGRTKDHTRRFVCFNGLLPTRRTETPTVAGSQTWEADFRHGGGQVVTARPRERQKLLSHHSADSMASHVLLTCVAAAVAIEAR